MKNFSCPNCLKPTISFWRRQIIGPTAPAECSNCTALVATTWKDYLWPIVPFVVLWANAEFFVESRPLYWALNIAGLVIWLWLANTFVPLIVKEPPLPQKPAA